MKDGFSGYNQVAVHPDDQKKTTFTTLQGTFMYSRMPFVLINVGVTFQKVMDIAFMGEQDKFVVVYLDDITYSQKQMKITSFTYNLPSINAEDVDCP